MAARGRWNQGSVATSGRTQGKEKLRSVDLQAIKNREPKKGKGACEWNRVKESLEQ